MALERGGTADAAKLGGLGGPWWKPTGAASSVHHPAHWHAAFNCHRLLPLARCPERASVRSRARGMGNGCELRAAKLRGSALPVETAAREGALPGGAGAPVPHGLKAALCPSRAEPWAFSLSDQLKLKPKPPWPSLGVPSWQRGTVHTAAVEAVLPGALVCFPAHLLL